MILNHYTRSSDKCIYKETIIVGTSSSNSKTLKMNKKYNHPKFYPIKFEKWSDEFSFELINDNLIVKRTDSNLGWGECLKVDVEYELQDSNNNTKISLIPKVIYQTFKTYNVPINMYKSIQTWKDVNPDYEHYYFDDDDSIEFIKKYFDKRVLNAYLSLIPGAFKADLWRCCVLYEKGGVYVDADMVCLQPLRDYIENSEYNFISCRDDPMAKSYIYNAFIACSPKHPFLKEQIDTIVKNTEEKKDMWYLDISGPALLGKSINKVCGRNINDDFEIGENKLGNYKFNLLLHSSGSIKIDNQNTSQLILVEYEGKSKEMNELNIESYYSLYKKNFVYQVIPRNIYYTTRDCLGKNIYMVDSFKHKNDFWNLQYFNDEDCLQFIKNNNDTFIKELNVDVLSYYSTLINGGEKSDLWRYCIIYLNGGVYVDADTYCNSSLDNWIKYHDLILGIEAYLPIDIAKTFGMDKIGKQINNNIISVCNWCFAASPRHIFFKKIIIDICLNPILNDVLINTGPGRITKHTIEYFSDVDLSLIENESIVKNKSVLFNINKFGSNQCHSNSYKNFSNPFSFEKKDIYIVHMFEGSWRSTYNHKEIKIYDNFHYGVCHNLTLIKSENKYFGISRIDKDTSRTIFMEKIGDCRSLLEINFDEQLNITSSCEKLITNYNSIAKFEDYRFFSFKDKTYIACSYIDTNFNTKVCVLDESYKYLGDINIENYNKVSFTGEKKIWEKNWLFIEKDNELYFIYSSTPKYIVYKCNNFDELTFYKFISIDWPLNKNVPNDEIYFTGYVGSEVKINTGGSTNPIFIKSKNIYLYLIHTKINNEFKYNHYAVVLDTNLIPIIFCEKPIINKLIPYNLCFITTILESDNYFILSGGVSDKNNFTWEISKEIVFKQLGI